MFWLIDQVGLVFYAVGVFLVYAVAWYFIDPVGVREDD